MPIEPKKIPVAFYRTAHGAEPVRDWLKDLDVEDRRVIGKDIMTVEYGWPVGMLLKMSDNPHIGSSFDDFLAEEGLLEECQAQAVKRVLSWQV